MEKQNIISEIESAVEAYSDTTKSELVDKLISVKPFPKKKPFPKFLPKKDSEEPELPLPKKRKFSRLAKLRKRVDPEDKGVIDDIISPKEEEPLPPPKRSRRFPPRTVRGKGRVRPSSLPDLDNAHFPSLEKYSTLPVKGIGEAFEDEETKITYEILDWWNAESVKIARENKLNGEEPTDPKQIRIDPYYVSEVLREEIEFKTQRNGYGEDVKANIASELCGGDHELFYKLLDSLAARTYNY